MSGFDSGKAHQELADMTAGVSQEWSITHTSSLVPDLGAVSLHRDFRNLQGFERYMEYQNIKNGQDLSGLSPSYKVRGPAAVVLLTGEAHHRLAESNRAGEVVEFSYEERDVLDGIMAVTTCN